MNRIMLVAAAALAGVLATPPVSGQEDEGSVLEAVKRSLAANVDDLGKAGDELLDPLPAALDSLLVRSKDRPEKVVQDWDQAIGRHQQRFDAFVVSVEGPGSKHARPRAWKEYRRSREAFVEELRAAGRSVALWRHQARLRIDSLGATAATFPARRDIWLKQIATVDETMSRAEALLQGGDPDPKKLGTAKKEVTGVKSVAENVAYDATAVSRQAQAGQGQAVAPPAAVAKAQQDFATVDTRHEDVPQAWRDTVRGWAEVVKQVGGQLKAAQEAHDRTFADVVKQQVFKGSPHFQGRQYLAFGDTVGALVVALDAARDKANAERARLRKQDRDLNAAECKSRDELLDKISPEKYRAAVLKFANGCSAEDCFQKRREAANGPCGLEAVREARLTLARFEGTADPEAQRLARFLQSCEDGTHPEQKKLAQSRDNVCGKKGPECQKVNAEWDAWEKTSDRANKDLRRLNKEREERRRKIGLDPDPDWKDCP